jgi:hypothetical protein
MDVQYDLGRGILKLSMESYIESTMARFDAFDLSHGCPYRELVGCLLWVTLNVMGPELLRVKDLARKSNSFGELDYVEALKVLRRISYRKHHGILIFRHAAGKEIVPSSKRTASGESGVPVGLWGECGGAPPMECDVSPSVFQDNTGTPILSTENELVLRSLCGGKALFSGSEVSPYGVEDPESIDQTHSVACEHPVQLGSVWRRVFCDWGVEAECYRVHSVPQWGAAALGIP